MAPEPQSPHPDIGPRTMAEDATALHEVYVSLQAAGFTDSEALVLVGMVMVGGRDAMRLVEHILNR